MNPAFANQMSRIELELIKQTRICDLSGRGLTVLPPEITQLTSLQTLQLNDNGLTTLPPEITQLTSLQTLSLSNNGLTTLPPEITRLTSLQTLQLNDNGLTTLPPEITQLTSLQTLSLSNNGLTTLPPEITRLTSLQTLQLNDNELTALPPEITQLTSLQTLQLDSNELTALPPEITELTSLQTLWLDSNGLTVLPPEITQLTSLQELTLNYNRLTVLPPEITQLTSLQELWLHGNGLTVLPPEITQLTSLQTLQLDSNKLTALPPEITQLTSLQTLSLSSNGLTTLPAEITRLTSLQTLQLDSNGLTVLPPEIAQLTSLQTLRLSSNKLTVLPPEIAQLTSLQTLSLSNNGLTTLPPEIAQLTSLQTLTLSNNGLTTLPPEIAQLTSLQTLSLSSNKLTTLPPEIAQLTSLQTLSLSSNKLTTLPPEIAQLTSLQTLQLDNNGLTALPPEITQLTSLQTLTLSGNKLTTLPEIAQLTSLQELMLSSNGLTVLPPEIAQLTSLQTLTLSSNGLTVLPPEIAQLTSLQTLTLDNNGLTALPPEIAQLTSLQTLRLSSNKLTALPPEIAQLTSLQELMLSSNGLTVLPPEIAQLTSLQTLQLDGNGLTVLPPEITQLTSLRTLMLNYNRLTVLPPEITQLTSLQALMLDGNGLTVLPPEIIQLTSLQELSLDGNKLTALPPEIAQLTSLQELWLNGNGLTVLPPEIAQLASLQTLRLDSNKLTVLPPEIAQLTSLRTLQLTGNGLTALPPEIADRLDAGLDLVLDGNPLTEPLPELITQGRRAVAVYLRSLRDGISQYEAKVLLVGEGNVGKTSLSAALRGDVFVQGRPFTHGINIQSFVLMHPGTGQEMTIRLWDFGGQEVYRITHQFFFSQRALYVVVWKPREGQEQNEVEGWLRRIQLRVGPAAQVLIVATHCADEKYPDLDYPQLQRQFPGMLMGNFAVDNETEHDIAKLREAIAGQVARLPQMGQKISSRWVAVRNLIMELADSEPQISFSDFVDLCRRNQVSDEESGILAGYMHELGQIIYYSDDEGLQDFVVLNPEWLTTAISYVLRDDPTRKSGGILDHNRLRDIWGGAAGYPVRYHRYFLRLMEKFEISYRLEDEQRSLLAQLVPYPRPDLPWDSYTPLPGRLRRLALVCQLSEPAPGLMAWLTVRHHRAATGRHWRTGVFLRYPIAVYDSEALLELPSLDRLSLEVRAPSPDLYFHVLRDSIETLIESRWPGLTYQLLIPCPTVAAGGNQCPQLVGLDDLLAYREEGEKRYLCTKCRTRHDVSALLTGFAAQGQLLTVEVKEQLTRVESRVMQIEGQAAETAAVVRRVLRVVSTEVSDCPSVFTLTRDRPAGDRRLKFYQHHYRLTLWCQHPEYWHSWDQAVYEIDPPKEWFSKIRPYAALIARTLQLVVPLAGAIAVASLPPDQIEAASAHLEVMKTIVDDLPGEPFTDPVEVGSVRLSGEMTAAEGAGLRMLRALVFEHDPAQHFGGLRRVVTSSGDFLWICPDHYGDYDPGLPAVP